MASYSTIADFLAAQGEGSALALSGGPPGANGSYNIAGATAVLSNGVLNGWTINGAASLASMDDVSGSYTELIGFGGTNVNAPGSTAAYMSNGIWLGYNIGEGDFDFQAKVSMTNSAGSGAANLNTCIALGFGRVISTTPNDSPIVFVRRGATVPPAIRFGGGAYQSTGRSNILSASPGVASNTAYWMRLQRTTDLIQAYYKQNDGDAWTELTSGATDYNVGRNGMIMFALTLGAASERFRIHQLSFTGTSP